MFDYDQAIAASRKWSDKMVSERGEMWVIDMEFKNDRRYDEVAREAFGDLSVSAIEIGHGLDEK